MSDRHLEDGASDGVLAKFMRALFRPVREVAAWLGLTGAADKANLNEDHGAYRKCPACGERDLRISDRQRSRPNVYGSRTFQVKWLCLSCGDRHSDEIEDPAG